MSWTSNARRPLEDARNRDEGGPLGRHCFEEGVSEEKDALRPVARVASLEEEGPAADDFKFARRFMKVLNLRGL